MAVLNRNLCDSEAYYNEVDLYFACLKEKSNRLCYKLHVYIF